MTLRQIFIKNMKYYRKKCGYTQEKLAEKLEMSTSYIGDMEARNRFPSVETIEKMAGIFGIKASALFEEEGCPENVNDFSAKKYKQDLKERIKDIISKDLDNLFEQENS